MDETTMTAGENTGEETVTGGESLQDQPKDEGTTEKVSALQKFINGLFGGDKGDETGKKDDGSVAEGSTEEKTFTKEDVDAAIEAARQKWSDEAAEAERLKKLTPEEKAKEEQAQKDSEIASLKSQLLQKELRENAAKTLESDGFPAGLADVLDYSSKERMEETLKNTTKIFKDSLAAAIQTRLKGKTPEGLGGAASAENLLRDQIARNIRGL